MSAEVHAVGIVGTFADLTLHCSRRTWMMHVELPFDAWDPVAKNIGLPQVANPGCPEILRTVAVLSCRAPVHPTQEADVLADAALRLAAKLLREGAVVSIETSMAFVEAWQRTKEGRLMREARDWTRPPARCRQEEW